MWARILKSSRLTACPAEVCSRIAVRLPLEDDTSFVREKCVHSLDFCKAINTFKPCFFFWCSKTAWKSSKIQNRNMPYSLTRFILDFLYRILHWIHNLSKWTVPGGFNVDKIYAKKITTVFFLCFHPTYLHKKIQYNRYNY